MEGVEILNTIEESVSGGAAFAAILCAALTLLCVICATVEFVDKEIISGLSAIAIGLVFCAIACLAFLDINIPARYKITISDSVSFNEFNEKYKVIDQDGKIFTVEEKGRN